MRIILIPGNNTFHRSVRDENGAILRTLTFEEGVAVELEGDELDAVRKDIGPALCIARDDRDQPDWKATEDFRSNGETPLQHVARKMFGGKKQKQAVGAASDE